VAGGVKPSGESWKHTAAKPKIFNLLFKGGEEVRATIFLNKFRNFYGRVRSFRYEAFLTAEKRFIQDEIQKMEEFAHSEFFMLL
jgi:hypothetical protein